MKHTDIPKEVTKEEREMLLSKSTQPTHRTWSLAPLISMSAGIVILLSIIVIGYTAY